MHKSITIWLTFAFLSMNALLVLADTQQENVRPLKIGAVLTLSGNFAAAGEDSRRGIEAALAEHAEDNLLQILYEDSRNEPSVAVLEF